MNTKEELSGAGMKKLDLHDVSLILNGSIEPYGSTHIDEVRLENLNTLCQLVDRLLLDIYRVSRYRTRQEASMKKMGECAYNFLSKVREADYE